jgi:two-component system, NtrC family, sensor histidine kinase PilS
MAPMPVLAHQLRWYITIRVLVISSVLLLYGLAQLTWWGGSPDAVEIGPTGDSLPASPATPPAVQPVPPAPPAPVPEALPPRFVLGLAGLTFALTLLYLALYQLLHGHYPFQAYVQFGGDLLLVSVLVQGSGGLASPFSMLYLIVIAVASTLLRRRVGVTVASAAYLLYLCLVLLPYRELPPGGFGALALEGRLFYNLVAHLLGFYAVAFLTSYLARDVTRAERELEAKSEDLADLQVVHRDVIESITSGLITTGLDGQITSVNRAGQKILRRAEAELVGTRVQDSGLLPPERWDELTAGSEPRRRRRSEAEITAGGERAFVGFSISRLADAEGTLRGYIVIFQDLTRWRRLQEEVRIKDRMAAVGELAAGLAHEIGNPLAAISGSVQMLSATAASSADAGGAGGDQAQRKLIDILLKESQRLDRTIKGFLRFARPRERSGVQFDVARLLAENFELLRNSQEVSDHHRLDLRLDPPSAQLVADPDQVSQIFWNLARNALRAMPDGGVLRVVGEEQEDAYRLQVIDDGHGMSEEQRANLFHPFRSFFDSGTGLGMAIVYRIVQEHGGTVAVDSRPGAGTTVTVELPAAALDIGGPGGPGDTSDDTRASQPSDTGADSRDPMEVRG